MEKVHYVVNSNYVLRIFYLIVFSIAFIYLFYGLPAILAFHEVIITNSFYNHVFYSRTFNVPIDILINCLMVITGIYGGSESTYTFLRSRSLPMGNSVHMPDKQLCRINHIFIAWVILAVAVTIMNAFVPEDSYIDFKLENIYTGLMVAITCLVTASKSDKIGEQMHSKEADKLMEKSNDFVSENKKNDNNADSVDHKSKEDDDDEYPEL